MGSFDGTEIYELVGLYIQSKLEKIFPKSKFGLHRDDGLALLRNLNWQQSDIVRKNIIRVFKDIGFSLRLELTVLTKTHTIRFFTSTVYQTTHQTSYSKCRFPSKRNCEQTCRMRRYSTQELLRCCEEKWVDFKYTRIQRQKLNTPTINDKNQT